MIQRVDNGLPLSAVRPYYRDRAPDPQGHVAAAELGAWVIVLIGLAAVLSPLWS